MHLVTPLACGVSGAANGYAQLFRRGTSTRANWYSSFEAETGTQNATGADVALDSNGGAVVYVAEFVDVIVKDANGTTIREFVAGSREDAVEVQSVSFTGTHYETAASGANLPVPLSTVMDRWLDSAGAIDWKVLFGGSSITIQQAVAGNIYINVKSTAYGAVGDGVADDTSAINAAVLAAEAAGGLTVYFPPGTYLITDSIDVKEGVGLLGSGVETTTIKRDSSNFTLLDFEVVASTSYNVAKLTLQDASTGTAQPVMTTQNDLYLEHIRVWENSTTGSNSPLISTGPGALHMLYVKAVFRGGAGTICARTGGGPLQNPTLLTDCHFIWTGGVAYTATGLIGIVRAKGTRFEVSTSSGFTPAIIINAYPQSSITGNAFTSSLSAPDTCAAIQADGAAGGSIDNGIMESGNQFDAIFTLTGPNNGKMSTRSRQGRQIGYTQAAPGTVNIDASFGLVLVRTTGIAGTYTMAMQNATSSSPGELDIIIRNTSAANHTIDFSGTSPVDTGVALNAGQVLRARYIKAIDIAGTEAWFRQTAFTITAI